MRTVIHETFGEPADLLRLGDQPMPEPGPAEIRIRTLLTPLHIHDLWTIRGEYGYKPGLPAIGGSEAVGVVGALVEGVTSPALGQPVTVAGVQVSGQQRSSHGSRLRRRFLTPSAMAPPPS